MNIIVYTFPFRGHSMQAIKIANYLSSKCHKVIVDANSIFFHYISPNIVKQKCLYEFFEFEDDSKKDNILNCAEGVLVTTNRYANQFDQNVDLIIYDSMAYWGKYIADKYNIKSISLFTIQPFDKQHFNDYAFEYLRGYTSKYATQKDFFRNIHIYQVVAKKKFNLIDDFSFDDFFCARGLYNVVLLPKSVCKFANELEDSYSAFSPMLECNSEQPDKNDSIYIATGSMISNLDLLISCIDSLLCFEKDMHISSGKHTEFLQNKYSNYKNINFYEFAPQEKLLKQASVFITHGGTNSMCEAIASKTPMIVIPLVNDEFLNAEMIVQSGIGIELENDLSVIKNNLSYAYESIIQNNSYAEKISTIAKEINYNRVLKIIDEIVEGDNYEKL